MIRRAAATIHVHAFRTRRRPMPRALGRQLAVLLCERLRTHPGLHPVAWLEQPAASRGALRCAGTLALRPETPAAGQCPRIVWRLGLWDAEGERRWWRSWRCAAVPELFAAIEEAAVAVAAAAGCDPAAMRSEPPPVTRSYPALRDWLRAIDLDDGLEALEDEDRRRALEWLLFAIEADPAFAPARDALLVSALRAHEDGLRAEARGALRLGCQLAPLDARLPFVLGELLALDHRFDEAVRAFERCLSVDPGHEGARGRLRVLGAPQGEDGAGPGTNGPVGR